MSLFGTWAELQGVTQIVDILGHFQIQQPVWDAFTEQIGNPGNDVRLLAALPAAAVVQGVQNATVNGGNPMTAIQATQVGLAWRMARRTVAHRGGVAETEFVDVDPWAPEPTPSPTSTGGTNPQGSSGVKERVLKMAALIDQTDDSELLPPQPQDVDKWIQNYVVVMGAQPEEAEEPSPSQLAALAKRSITLGQAPYTDFGIWVPFERKMAKTQKFRIYTPLGDGSYLQRDLPGPPTYQAWRASWAVFRTAALMLGLVSLAALETYARHIERLVTQWPQCWGLVYTADDTARAERLDRMRRHLTVEAARGRQVPVDWDPMKPWSCLFVQLTKDVSYWAEKVHHPAAAWVAAGARGAPVVASEAAVLNTIPGGHAALSGEQGGQGEGDERAARRRQGNKDRKVARKRRAADEKEELKRLRNASLAHGTNSEAKGKGKGKTKSKDQTGQALCFSWASGTGACANVPPGGECQSQVKRVHKCRPCLSPSHRDADCKA